jgi:hypothetical protein
MSTPSNLRQPNLVHEECPDAIRGMNVAAGVYIDLFQRWPQPADFNEHLINIIGVFRVCMGLIEEVVTGEILILGPPEYADEGGKRPIGMYA